MSVPKSNPIQRATIRIESAVDKNLIAKAYEEAGLHEPEKLEKVEIDLSGESYRIRVPDCTTRERLNLILEQLESFFRSNEMTLPCIFSFADSQRISVSIVGSIHAYTKDMRERGIKITTEVPAHILENQPGLEKLLSEHFHLEVIDESDSGSSILQS